MFTESEEKYKHLKRNNFDDSLTFCKSLFDYIKVI